MTDTFMHCILGIDSAWTPANNSGVAVVLGDGHRWHCVVAAPGYAELIALANGDAVPGAISGHGQGLSDPALLPNVLEAAGRLAGTSVDLVVLDMPLSRVPFSSRRVADDSISRAFGSRKCSTHSPTAQRPGRFGEEVLKELVKAGYSLQTTSGTRSLPAMIETYPHPALLTLLERAERVPYKYSKSTKYWKGATLEKRYKNIVGEFKAIHSALETRFGRLPLDLPDASCRQPLSSLKPTEDQLDALVCAWVGVEHMAGRTEPFGDAMATIWVPVKV